jgi:acetyltransferase
VRDARARRRGTLDAPLAPPPEPPLPGALDEHEAKALLEAHGLRAPRRRACGTREQAHAALGALRAPLAVKALDPAVGHKTDVGALVLGVAGAAALDAALERIAAALGGPPARGFLLEEMAPPGSDFIVGAVRDPAFGPAVVVGWGGVLAEALERTAVRLAPVHPAQAARMLTEIGLPERARGGGEPPERGPLVQAVCAVGDLLAAHPEIAELDVNPVRMTPDGLLALDALVVLDTVERESKEQQWIWS